MGGVLVLAAGVPRAFASGSFGVVTLGYVIMRAGLLSQWLRAAAGDPDRRAGALRYVAGIAAAQVGWVGMLALPPTGRTVVFSLLVVVELAIPTWAERGTSTPWHPGHIAERYGLFTIIVLGESVLSTTVALQQALDAGTAIAPLVAVGVGGLLTVFALWSIYFAQPVEEVAHRARGAFHHDTRAAFSWGYGHVVVFASAAAVGAGLALQVDRSTGRTTLGHLGAGLALTLPAVAFVLVALLLHGRCRPSPATGAALVVVLAASALPATALVTGVALGTVAVLGRRGGGAAAPTV